MILINLAAVSFLHLPDIVYDKLLLKNHFDYKTQFYLRNLRPIRLTFESRNIVASHSCVLFYCILIILWFRMDKQKIQNIIAHANDDFKDSQLVMEMTVPMS